MWLELGNLIGSLINQLTFLPDWVRFLISGLIGIVGILLLVVVGQLITLYWERKLIAQFQVRTGLMRVGWHGTLQPIADALKVLLKEDIVPNRADKVVFSLAPVAALVPILLSFAVYPFGPSTILRDLNIGILYALAIASTSVIGVFMAGWSSNNKFALIGAMRTVAQMVGYEVPLVLSVVGVILLTGLLPGAPVQVSPLSTIAIVNLQAQLHAPLFVVQPLGLLVYFIAQLAELNRTPFDIMEAENELTAGYHTEYSGFRFAIFYLAEYTAALGFCILLSTLFFGGWLLFGLENFVPPVLVVLGKAFFFFSVLVWIRATLPRLRIDQLMGFCWKFLVPLALANVIITGLVVAIWPNDLAVIPMVALAVVEWAALFAALWLAGGARPRQKVVRVPPRRLVSPLGDMRPGEI